MEESSSDICVAIRRGNVEHLCTLIKNGSPADVADPTGWRPLHYAAAHVSDVKCLKELLKHGRSNINWQTRKGETALLLACRKECPRAAVEAVDILLHYGADANIADRHGTTPLIDSIRNKKMDVAVELINYRSTDPNLGDSSGCRPVHEAAREGNLQVLKCLLQANVSVHVQDRFGETPFCVAAEYGNDECLKELLRAASEKGLKMLIDLDSQFGTPLMIAAATGHVTCVEVLLDHGANPNLDIGYLVDIPGCATALHMAILRNSDACFEILLNKMDLRPLIHPQDPTSRDYISPLHLAMKCWNHKFLKMLLSAGFSADSIGAIQEVCLHAVLNHVYTLPFPSYETALSFAASLGNVKSMKILLDCGASVNPISCTSSGNSRHMTVQGSYPPVLSALFNRTWEALDLLVDHGCDISYCRAKVNSNECLLFSFYDYHSTKKLLLCGSDPHLCFREGTADSQAMFVYQLSSILSYRGQDVVLKILDLLLQFTVITGPVQSSYRAVSSRCKTFLGKEYVAEKWNTILQQIDEPSSLKNSSRIKVRQLMISLHNYSSFRKAINGLCVPYALKQYLLYSELDESCRDLILTSTPLGHLCF